jgi:AcrR family transcriptional regulator
MSEPGRRSHHPRPDARHRRTQAERSAETVGKLLDATVACLVERGYARTSTNDICRRAGVSRGALLHHFPSKAVLVAAACGHVFDRRVDEFREAMAHVPEGEDRLAAAIDVLWSLYQGETPDAWLELIVAGRTDADLRPHVALAAVRLTDTIFAVWNELFLVPPDTDPAVVDQLRVAPLFLFTVLDGLAVARMTAKPGADADAEAVLALVKLAAADLAPLLAPGAPASTAGPAPSPTPVPAEDPT